MNACPECGNPPGVICRKPDCAANTPKPAGVPSEQLLRELRADNARWISARDVWLAEMGAVKHACELHLIEKQALEARVQQLTKLIFRISGVAQNARNNPEYLPYCMRCVGLHRMQKVGPYHWKHDCGAECDLSALGESRGSA